MILKAVGLEYLHLENSNIEFYYFLTDKKSKMKLAGSAIKSIPALELETEYEDDHLIQSI